MYFIKFRMLYSCGKFVLVSMTARFPFVALPKNAVIVRARRDIVICQVDVCGRLKTGSSGIKGAWPDSL